ncbi:unnamed protein product, partial [Meganyctiphanes norvegica]
IKMSERLRLLGFPVNSIEELKYLDQEFQKDNEKWRSFKTAIRKISSLHPCPGITQMYTLCRVLLLKVASIQVLSQYTLFRCSRSRQYFPDLLVISQVISFEVTRNVRRNNYDMIVSVIYIRSAIGHVLNLLRQSGT